MCAIVVFVRNGRLTGGLAGSGLGEDDDGVVLADPLQDGVLACSPNGGGLDGFQK